VIGIIIKAARKDWNLDMAKNNSGRMEIPDSKEASTSELAAIVG